MAIDGIYLYSLVQDLKKSILNSKIDKINQPEKDEIIITLRKERKNLKLLISASPKYPRFNLTTVVKSNPLQAPMFTMVLRKYLIGGKIIDIVQQEGDRIVKFFIEASDELGFNSVYTLIVEIMGRHSNITLVRERDNKIMECIKHIAPSMNSYRVLYPGITYKYPPESTKINPFSFNDTTLQEFMDKNSVIFNKNFFVSCFTGISTSLSEHLFIEYNKNYTDFSINNIFAFINNFINTILDNKIFKIYKDKDGDYIDFYVTPLSQLEEKYTFEILNDIHELMDKYYLEKDKQERIKGRSVNLQKLVTTNIERCIKKENKLNDLLKKCEDKDDFKIKGDLLTSYIYSIKKGDKTFTTVNFFSEDSEEITIPLDENKTPSENVQSYYKKYNKLKKSEESAIEQLEKNHQELQYLYSVLTNIENCESYTEIDDIKEELISTGYVRKRKSNGKNSKKSKESKPLHYISSDGIDIFVGKNNIQNDYLSLKFANKNFMWLHTKNIPGSHVIICSNDIPDSTLVEGATLAAHYSKAKDSSKVPVDYTLVKNLKKPNGANPGMVIYHTNYTMFVEPSEFNNLNIKKK
ncbi:NFACT family protein [uncultured Clostridium sp.]|uniref:Rqc2 family fibronectin-binding protein n=1 Tax=uncultured Clostridium sp. TaxID=59620 RepID=UPI0025D19F2F|nr:NFACT RNA binding domain-containing protein [uncultured Clostridium sp.]MDU4882860.1 NFACT RNA binding domain-containing protein [Clostridium celatum]MDU7075778.1 NFACT RNA binding domain-containing protein [Clostridium celatum]